MQETDDSVLVLPPFISANPAPFGLCTMNSGLELCSRAGTAVLHSIIRLKTQFRTRNLPNSLSTNTSLRALWQTGRNVFLQPLSYSFICNNVLGNQVWTIFIAQMPARRSSSLCSSALWIAHTWKQRAPRHCKDKSSCLKIQCMTAAAWASSLLQNTGFRRSCSHSKPHWVPSTSQYPSWCSQHKAASIPWLILVLHTPLTLEKKQWCVRAPRNPENSRDEKARWDGSKEKQKIWSYF